MVYKHFSWKADCIATSNRADAVLLAVYKQDADRFSRGMSNY